jgi:glyoxylase-like metal-dependent hydrolase (beta-lactamase superfamily II)
VEVFDMADFKILDVQWSTFLLDGGAMFGIIPKPLWQRLIPADENNGIRLAMRSMMVVTQNRLVLVDCGVWGGFPEKLRDQVYAIQQPDLARTFQETTGRQVGDVTDIIASHLHFDHVGGFVHQTGRGLEPTFPNATLHVQKSQLEWARNPSDKDRGSYVVPLIEAISSYEKLTIHDGPWALLQGLEMDVVDGHTRGMQIVRVRLPDRWLIHTADMVPTSAHVPVPYIMAYDIEPMKTGQEKRRYYQDYPSAAYFFEHDPEHAFWTLATDARGNTVRGNKFTP